MIVEGIEQIYEVRQGTRATYPHNFLYLVVHGEHDLPWYRRFLRRLKGTVTTTDGEHKQRLEGRR